MQSQSYNPLVHRFAVATASMALVPIAVGAVVTTLGAGMAFPDWPSSDGHSMLAYPWLESVGHKFVEHGHRLAGMAIGIVSIGFAFVALLCEKRRWAKFAAFGVLLAVIAQGLLGGQRVLSDARQLAMLHGSLAALVFALMGSVALVTSRGWWNPPLSSSDQDVAWMKPLALATPVVIFGQYLLGGALRHLGHALYEHAGLAFVVLVFVVGTWIAARRSGIAWLRRSGNLLLTIAILQISLGLGAWATKFGLASLGYVAVQHSTLQVLVRTSHTVVGMMLFMSAVVFALRVLRVIHWQQHGNRSIAAPSEFISPVVSNGGAV
ncbi:MAG: heme A synthase [Planctomycetaceae bacterium]